MQTEYSAYPLTRTATAIEEESGVRCFLFEGKRRALLVDTGHGGGDLKDFVETLTPRPVTLLNTHADRDHIGGNAPFGKTLLHPDDRDRYVKYGGSPDDITPLTEGEVIALGGLSFTVLHVPGHTPGSVALFDAASGTLVAGDTIQNEDIYMFGPGRDMETYMQSLKKLIAVPAKRIYASHGDVELPASYPRFLYKDALAMLAGEITPKEAEVHGHKVLEYHGNVSCFLRDAQP